MLFLRTIAAVLLSPFIWFFNLFRRSNNVLEWHLNFGKSSINIRTVTQEAPTEALLISAYLLFVGRYFFICDQRQEHSARQALKEIAEEKTDTKIAALHLYEAIHGTLNDGEKGAVSSLFMMGIPPIVVTQNEEPANSLAKYSFLIFVRNQELYGNLHLSFGPDIVLLPISLGVLYDFVAANVTGRNKQLLKNGVLALLELQKGHGARSMLAMHQQPVEIIRTLQFE